MPFRAHDIEENDTAYGELIALGFRTVPVTRIGDRVIKGFDAAALTSAIDAWRARS